MNQVMQTYLNSPDLKARFLGEIAAHEAADMILQGTYGEGEGCQWKGCAVGCSLRSLNKMHGATDIDADTDTHARYPTELGWPLWLAYLEDHIFEHLPVDLAKTWPRRLAEAIPVGAVVDDTVLARILRWGLADPEFGVRFATDDAEIRGYIDAVIAVFDLEIAGTATAEQREAAARAARAAWAAWDAWDARAAWAAWAAWAARDAWAAWDARAEAVNPAVKKAEAFFPALSEFVLSVLRDLSPADAVAR